MDHQQIREWETTLDEAESNRMQVGFPASPLPGTEHITGDQHWIAVSVLAGNTGARWAYWAPEEGVGYKAEKTGPNKRFEVVVDKIFNGDVHHFAGMLAVPYVKTGATPVPVWVLTEPRYRPPNTPLEIREKPKERYERSKEVYDVETGESRKLP